MRLEIVLESERMTAGARRDYMGERVIMDLVAKVENQ